MKMKAKVTPKIVKAVGNHCIEWFKWIPLLNSFTESAFCPENLNRMCSET